MKIAGDAVLHAPVERVWDALLDPEVLVRTIPGCERLEPNGENTYAMTVTAGVAAIKGTYSGSYELQDLQRPDSLVLKASGAGAPGTIGATVKVAFADNDDGTTRVDYDADAVVGGMIGGVGQRMLTSVSNRMAGDFFRAIDGVLTGAEPEPAAAARGPAEESAATKGAAQRPAAALRPAAVEAVGAPDDFRKGVLVGAGLVLAGVVAGALAARRHV